MKGSFNYANGMLISQSRRMFKFYFGDFFVKCNKNDKKLRFDIYLIDKIKIENESGKEEIAYLKDWCDVEYFCEFWNGTDNTGAPKKEGTFNVIIMKEDSSKND